MSDPTMTTATRPLVCRHCGDHLTPIPGGWIDKDGWDICADSVNVHEPADPPAPNDAILNRYLAGERVTLPRPA